MIKMRLKDFVDRKMDVGYPADGGISPEYVGYASAFPDNFTNDYYGNPILLFVDEPVDFDRFLRTDHGQRFVEQMLPWFDRWIEADRVSHICISYDSRWQEVGFRVWFKNRSSMNGGIVMNRDGEWSSHT